MAGTAVKPLSDIREGLVAMIGLCVGVGAWALWELAGRICGIIMGIDDRGE